MYVVLGMVSARTMYLEFELDEWCEFVLGNFRNFWQLVSSNYFV